MTENRLIICAGEDWIETGPGAQLPIASIYECGYRIEAYVPGMMIIDTRASLPIDAARKLRKRGVTFAPAYIHTDGLIMELAL